MLNYFSRSSYKSIFYMPRYLIKYISKRHYQGYNKTILFKSKYSFNPYANFTNNSIKFQELYLNTHVRFNHNLSRSNLVQKRSTRNYIVAVGVLAIGISYAAVPLYRIFCQVILKNSAVKKEKRSEKLTDDNYNIDKPWIEKIRIFFNDIIKYGSGSSPKYIDIEDIINQMKSNKCKNIIVMAGAGISTSAGIPDFRSPDSGLYSNLNKYNLPYPEAIFDIGYFKKNPKPFFILAKELYPKKFNPTPSHYFIKLLHNKGLLLRHYTQNIDTLEHAAGIPAEKIVEAHGSFQTSHCLQCKKEYEKDWLKHEIFLDRVPFCIVCGGLVKPDIVFFGENLPDRFYQLISEDFYKCDLLIIIGTSLTVYPFASLINDVKESCPRLLINKEIVGLRDPMMSAFEDMMSPLYGTGLFSRSGLRLGLPMNKRDIAMIGTCDEQCKILAEKLGWADELEELISKEKSL